MKIRWSPIENSEIVQVVGNFGPQEIAAWRNRVEGVQFIEGRSKRIQDHSLFSQIQEVHYIVIFHKLSRYLTNRILLNNI